MVYARNSMVIAGLVVAWVSLIKLRDVQVSCTSTANREEAGFGPRKSYSGSFGGARRTLLRDIDPLLAAVPMFFIEGTFGQIFRPMVVSYTFAVFAGMVAALVITPALSVIFLSGKRLEVRESPLVGRMQRSYQGMLARGVNGSGLAHIAIVVLIVAGIIASPFIRRDQMLPSFREPYLTVKWKGARYSQWK